MELALNDLSFVFWQIVFRSLLWSIAQAAVSTFLILFFSVLVGNYLVFTSQKIRRIASKFLDFWGEFLFALPGVVGSFVFLGLSQILIPGIYPQGLWAVVACNFLLGCLWSVSFVFRKQLDWIQGPGSQQLESWATLGANPVALCFHPAGPAVRRAMFAGRQILPLLFVTYFSSFSTVLILGPGGANATPEVMLFYSLLHEGRSVRTLAWVGVVLILGFCLNRMLNSPNLLGTPLSRRSPNGEHFFRGEAKPEILKWVEPPFKGIFGLSLLFLPVVAFGLGFVRIFEVKWGSFEVSEFFLAGQGSVTLMATTVVWGIFFLGVFLLEVPTLRSFFKNTWLLGPTTWAAVLILLLPSNLNRESFWLGGLACVLSFLPWLARAQKPLSALLPNSEVETFRVLGGRKKDLFFFLLLPRLKTVWIGILVLLALCSLGDASIPALFLGESETLASMGRRLGQRYNFSGMTLLTLVMFSASTLLFAIGKGKTRGTGI